MYWYSQRLDEQTTAVVRINETEFTVEVADSSAELEQGLSGREYLEDGHGMLFVFLIKSYPPIWMKDMKIPIDVIWIDDYRIVGFEENLQPQPEKPVEELRIYRSEHAVNRVLELPAGSVQKYNIQVGQTIEVE